MKKGTCDKTVCEMNKVCKMNIHGVWNEHTRYVKWTYTVREMNSLYELNAVYEKNTACEIYTVCGMNTLCELNLCYRPSYCISFFHSICIFVYFIDNQFHVGLVIPMCMCMCIPMCISSSTKCFGCLTGVNAVCQKPAKRDVCRIYEGGMQANTCFQLTFKWKWQLLPFWIGYEEAKIVGAGFERFSAEYEWTHAEWRHQVGSFPTWPGRHLRLQWRNSPNFAGCEHAVTSLGWPLPKWSGYEYLVTSPGSFLKMAPVLYVYVEELDSTPQLFIVYVASSRLRKFHSR